MFRTLLSPLSARFATSPNSATSPQSQLGPGSSTSPGFGFGRGGGEDDALSPEDFARDVLIEVMRKSVERLKFAEGLNARTEVRLYLGSESPILACIWLMMVVVDWLWITGTCGDS